MKKTKIIIPAMGMLLLGTAASVTGTVAWFSMNNSVAVTGMNVRTTVGSNILVSPDNAQANFTSGLDQPVTGILEPASSINGVDFFYHSTEEFVAGDGHSENLVFVEYDASDTDSIDAFDGNYGFDSDNDTADCLPYIDYSFYLKATNGESSMRRLAMSRCNLTYKGSALGDRAWRVAVFAKTTTIASETTVTEVSDAAAVDTDNLKSILKLSTAKYFGNDNKAVKDEDEYDDVVSLSANANLAEVNAAATCYCKVVVRLWLEGEDDTCNNSTYAELSGDFRLDLAFEMRNPSHATPAKQNGIIELTTLGNAVATGNAGPSSTSASITLTAGKLENGEIPASYQWKNEADGTSVGTNSGTYENAADSTARNVYCLVTTTRGNIYRSNTVSLIAVNPEP